MSDPVARLNAALEGRYAIERELGEGGMATVYLAEDIKHHRQVALKVLKPELAAVVGAERFLAEIQVTANLQHPNILPLFDSGEADSFLFYVMPYVEGDTLKDRLAREGQLPVSDAVEIARDVAEALQAAHEQGVIHRDIKPGNVLISRGKPLIADFGIALAISSAGGGERLTETDQRLGTPYYMSPEQATGDQPVGASTDTYALGCVLYEMLVGDPPYAGSTAQAVLGKIIAGKHISATEERPSVPANVDAAVRCALERLPADRFTSAQEFVRALEDEHFRYGELATVGAGAGAGGWRQRLAIVIAGVLVGVAGTAVVIRSLAPSSSSAVATRFQIVLPEDQRLREESFRRQVAISPDGRHMVYVANNQLYLRPLNSVESTPILGTESASNPFFSPDGAWVGFVHDAENSLKKVAVSGGTIVKLCDLPGNSPRLFRGASWNVDGSILFAKADGIFRVSDVGGDEPERLRLTAVEGEGQVFQPQMLPDGKRVLFGVRDQILVESVDSGEQQVLVDGARTARYLPTGHLVYVQERTLFVAPFNVGTLEQGPPVPLAEDVRGAQFDLTPTGALIYLNADRAGRTLVWVDRAGREEPLAAEPRMYTNPRISPDSTRIALDVRDQDKDIWIWNITRETLRRLTLDPAGDEYPLWTPDSRRVVFSSFRGGVMNLFWTSADGATAAERLSEDSREQRANSFSPDGELLVYRSGGGVNYDLAGYLAVLSMEVDRRSEPLLAAEFGQNGELSSDGHWLAYQSNRSGRFEIYVRPFPNVDENRWKVSTAGGTQPLWSRDGRELFYRDPDGRVVTVPVQTDPSFDWGSPEVVVSGQYFWSAGRSYDVGADGRFLMIKPVGAETADPFRGLDRIHVVQNWFEEFKQRIAN